IEPSRPWSAGCSSSENRKAALVARLRLIAAVGNGLRQWERRHVSRPRHRHDLDDLQLGIELIELWHRRVRLRLAIAHALFGPLLAIVDPHMASFPTAFQSH